MIEVHNVVGSGDLGRELALDVISEDLGDDARYDPSEFGGVLLSLDDRAKMMTVHSSGSYLIGGATDRETLHEAHDTLIDKFSELGIVDRPYNGEFEVVNLVCTADLGENINLNALAVGLGLQTVEYDPELFAGLVYSPEKGSAMVIIFESGKIVISGVETRDQAKEVYHEVEQQVADVLPSYAAQPQ